MRTVKWSHEKVGEGKYHCRIKAIGDSGKGDLLPGMILGGHGKWVVQVQGQQWPETFRTINDACSAIVSKHFGVR